MCFATVKSAGTDDLCGMKYARVSDTPHRTIAQSWNYTKAYYSTQTEQQISIYSIVLECIVYVLKWEVFFKISSNREGEKKVKQLP